MSVSLSPIGGVAAQFFDNNGNVLAGGKLYSYEAGTTTPKTTYTSYSGTIANSNPIILTSAGRIPYEVWLTTGDSYKFVLTDSVGNQIGTWDNIYGYSSGSVDAQTEVQTATADQTLFVLTGMAYTPGANTLGVYVDGVNQVVNNAYVETNATSVTFVSGLHVGATVKFINLNIGSTDASVVSYEPGLTGSVATTVQAKLRESVSVTDFGAVGDGVTDDTAAIQAALNYIKTDGGTLVFPYATYKCNSVLTLQLSSSAPNVRWNIEGNDSTLDFTSITSGDLLTVGATGLTYFPEHGSTRIANLKILGAETGNTTTDTPVSSVVGLFLHFASRVELDNVFVEKCYIGIKTAFVFPLQSIKSSVARNFIGLWHDDASNLQKWDQTSAKECRYGCVIYKSDTYSSSKTSVLQHTGLWVEDCSVGVHVDPGSSGSSTPIILHLKFNDGFYKGIVYDTFRFGIAFNFATPQTRGANRTMQIYDVGIDGGSWAGSAYDADTSAVTFSSNQNTREFRGLLSVADSSDAIVNAPSTGEILFKDNEATFAQNWTTKFYSGGNVVLTRETGGGLNWGNQSLNAYAETTFMPTIIGTSVAGTGTYLNQLGRATKIGNRVFFDIKLNWSAHTGSGNMKIEGLPYPSASADIASGVAIAAFSNVTLTASNVPLLSVDGVSATTISVLQTPVGGGAFSNVALDTAGTIVCSGSYEID